MNHTRKLGLGSRVRRGPFLTCSSGMHLFWLALALSIMLVAGCRTALNYARPDGPRYAGGTPTASVPPHAADTLRVVSFNIAFARQVDSALLVLTTDPELRDADILLLQEMDEPATRRIASALGMAYVFFPATLRFNTHRDFGNAVLSRWPIVADAKLVLPHRARISHTMRTATAATIRVGDTWLRLYSTHLATKISMGAGARRDQLRTVLADAAGSPRVILGGDMNDARLGVLARDAGYQWPTETGPRTTPGGRLDHIFVRGLALPDSAAAGTVLDVRHASDHGAVWVRVIVPTGMKRM